MGWTTTGCVCLRRAEPQTPAKDHAKQITESFHNSPSVLSSDATHLDFVFL